MARSMDTKGDKAGLNVGLVEWDWGKSGSFRSEPVCAFQIHKTIILFFLL